VPTRYAWALPDRADDLEKALGQCCNTGPTFALQVAQPFPTSQPPRRLNMNDTSHPNERKTDSTAIDRAALACNQRALHGGYGYGHPSPRLRALGLTASVPPAALSACYATTTGRRPGWAAEIEESPASRASRLIAIGPSTSANAGLRDLCELAYLLPFVARACLVLRAAECGIETRCSAAVGIAAHNDSARRSMR